MKTRLLVTILLMGTFIVCAGRDARGGTEEVQKTIQMASAVLLSGSASDDQMREMLRQLEKTATPNSYPHGRPTIIRLSTGQLEKEFHRT